MPNGKHEVFYEVSHDQFVHLLLYVLDILTNTIFKVLNRLWILAQTLFFAWLQRKMSESVKSQYLSGQSQDLSGSENYSCEIAVCFVACMAHSSLLENTRRPHQYLPITIIKCFKKIHHFLPLKILPLSNNHQSNKGLFKIKL